MGQQTLTTFDAALKEDYGPGLRNAVNNSNVILTEIQRNDRDIIGRRAVWAVHTTRSTGSGARAEGEALPPAGSQGFTGPNQALRYYYHTIKVTGPSIELTKGDRGSFRRALEAEMDGAENDIKNDVCRSIFGQFVGTAQTGALAQCGTTTASLTVQLATTTLRSEMRAFFVGMYIDITDNAGALITAGKARKITAIDMANETITIDTNAVADVSGAGSGVVTTSSSHYVSRHGAWNDEFPGLRAIIAASGTVHGVDPSTVPTWKSVARGSSTTPISEDLIEDAWDAIQTEGDGQMVENTLYVTAFEQRRTLANKLQAAKRYEGREMTLTAGWRGLNVSHGTLVTDKYAPEDRIFALNTKELTWFVGRDFGFDEVGGQTLFQALDGSDAVEARIKAYVALAATNRNSHAVITVSAV